MKPETGENFMKKWDGVVKKKLTKKIDIKHQIEGEIDERHLIHIASAVRNGNQDLLSDDGHSDRVRKSI